MDIFLEIEGSPSLRYYMITVMACKRGKLSESEIAGVGVI